MNKLSCRVLICCSAISLLFGASSCSEESPEEPCAPVLLHAIWVSVVDGETMTRVNTANGFVRDGDYIDSLRVRNGVAWAAEERAGTYEIVVRKDGYMEWSQDGVVVTRDRCHVQTVRLDIVLEKQ